MSIFSRILRRGDVLIRKMYQGDTLIYENPHAPALYVSFVDPEVRRICLWRWDTDHDNQLSFADVAAVTDIGYQNGNYTFSTSSIQYFDELQYFTGLTGVYTYDFRACTSLRHITLPPQIRNIGTGSFQDCTSLTEIVIPASVQWIGNETFSGCTALSVYMESPTPPVLNGPDPEGEYHIFYGVPHIYVPYGSVETYKAAAGWSNYASVISSY